MDQDQERRRRRYDRASATGLLILLLAACGGHRPPKPPPSIPRWTLDVQAVIAETSAPGAGAAIVILDGPNAGQKGITPATGRLSIPSLEQAGFTVCARLAPFPQACEGVVLTSSKSVTIKIGPPAPPPVVARRGQVVPSGKFGLRDDDGELLGYGVSLFWAVWGIDHDAHRLDLNLKAARQAGAEYVRVLATVGPGGWTDRSVDWKAPGWKDAVRRLRDRAASFGLRVEFSLLGGSASTKTSADREAMTRAFLDAIMDAPQRVWAIEVSNEANDLSGPEEGKRLARILRDRFPGLIGITSPDGDACEKQSAWYAGSAASIVFLHFSRSTDGEGGAWRPTRQPWRESRFSCPGLSMAVYSNDEPRGIRSSVSMESRTEILASDAITTWIAGVASYTFHSGAGIRGGGFEDTHQPAQPKFYIPRSANLFEQEAWQKTTKTIATLRLLIPPSVPNWIKESSRPAMFEVDSFDRVDRVYCARQDGASKAGTPFACSAVNVRGIVRLVAKKGLTVSVYSTVDAEKKQEVALASGQAVTIDASTPGALLIGRFQ